MAKKQKEKPKGKNKMKHTMNKKGNTLSLAGMGSIALIAVLAIVTMVVGVKVNQQIGDGLAVNSTAQSVAQNVSISGTSLFINLGSNFSLLGTILGLGLVLTTLVGAFVYSRNR